MAQDVIGVVIRTSHRADDRADCRVFTHGERKAVPSGNSGFVVGSTRRSYGVSRPGVRLIVVRSEPVGVRRNHAQVLAGVC